VPTVEGNVVQLPRPSLGEQGSVSAEIYSPHSLPVRGLPSVQDLERMLHYDSQARALSNGLSLPLRSALPIIEPEKGDKGEQEFATRMLFASPQEGGMSIPFDVVNAQMCRAITQRISFFEKVWKYDRDGKLVLHKLAYRRPTTCNVIPDSNGTFNGFYQQGFTTDGKFFENEYPPEKSLVYIHGSNADNPLRGESALESAYQDYQNKMKVSLLRYLYLQKFGLPPTVGKVDADSLEEQQKYQKKLQQMAGGVSIVLGPTEQVPTPVLQAASNVQDFQNTIDYLNTEMARSVQLQQIMLATTGATSSGSYSLSRDQTGMFLQASEARQRELEFVWTNYCIAPAIYYNFGPDAAFPSLKYQPLADEKKQLVVDTWARFYERAAIVPRPEVIEALEEVSIKFLGLDVAPPKPGAPVDIPGVGRGAQLPGKGQRIGEVEQIPTPNAPAPAPRPPNPGGPF
jgi:hypothetical protein